jgi:hypothetical protein
MAVEVSGGGGTAKRAWLARRGDRGQVVGGGEMLGLLIDVLE